MPSALLSSVLLRGTTLGVQFALAAVLPLLLALIGGRLLDRFLNTSPFFVLLGILIALVITGVLMTYQVRALMRKS